MKKVAKWCLAGFVSVLAVSVVVVGLNMPSSDGWAHSYSAVVGVTSTAPSKTFLTDSITKTKATDKYSRDCTITIDKATAVRTLNSEEQAEVDGFNAVAPKFKVRTISTTMGNDAKRIYTSKKLTNANGTTSVGIYADANGIYYPGDTSATWKGFFDQAAIDGVFESVKLDDVTSYFGASRKFSKWQTSGKTRTAVYSGKLTSDGNADFISTAFGEELVAGQSLATAKIYIDEKTQLWNKYEVTINKLKSGEVTFPLKGICKITYGNSVKVTIPSAVTWVDAITGATEMLEKMSAVY